VALVNCNLLVCGACADWLWRGVFYTCIQAPAEKVEEATKLMRHGLKCFGGALGLWAIRKYCCGYR
jgi:hypothetical protein